MAFDVDIWGTVAEWFAAVGTVGAVIMTLWLVRKPAREREDVHVQADLWPEDDGWSILVSITNMGERPVTITGVSVYFAGKLPDVRISVGLPFDELPARLEESAEVHLEISGSMIQRLLPKVTAPPVSPDRHRMTVEARTSRARTFRSNVPVLLPEIREAFPAGSGEARVPPSP